MPNSCDNRPEAGGGPLVGGPQVSDIIEALRRVDERTTDIARRAGFDLTNLLRAEPVAVSKIVQLFEEAERLTGDPLVGLRTGRLSEPRGLLAHLLISSARLDEALMRCTRLGPILIQSMRIESRGERDRIVFSYEDPALESRLLTDYTLMATLRTVQRAVGEDVHLAEVRFRRADDTGREEIELAFGCPVRFGQGADALVIPSSVTSRKGKLANPLIAEQIERFAEALLPSEPEPKSFTEQVGRTARKLLSAGVRAERRVVCKHLGLSERSLHRRLAEEGANFRELREKVLWDVAEALVSESGLKLEAIAASVGFNDAAAFSKAFKRHSGSSPTAWRRSRVAKTRLTSER
ncbi:MAG: AraC family transcriptional regulator ligand-binding domain-containing protein [Candidatus Binatia bacterium]